MFEELQEKKNWIIIAILALVLGPMLFRKLTNTSEMIGLIMTVPGLLLAISFHEAAHAFMADKLGDDTPRRQGRLTLNPFKHLDLIGTTLLFTVGFGWGKPVEINPNNFNRTVSIKKGNALVALAGPVANFIMALILSIVLGVLLKYNGLMMYAGTNMYYLYLLLYSAIMINVSLGVFNLIPLPPLDGSKILEACLSDNARNWYIEHEQLLYFIFMIAWISPLASSVISPVISGIGNSLIRLIAHIAGV